MKTLQIRPDATLHLEELVAVARDPEIKVQVPDDALGPLTKCRAGIDQIVKNYTDARHEAKTGGFLDTPLDELNESQRAVRRRIKKSMRYGISTGFGEFKNKAIAPENLRELQRKILLSHSTGIGFNSNRYDSKNYYSGEVIRACILLRIKTFIKGHSGIRLVTLRVLIWMLNNGIVPLVPVRGSVGSSGDLAPLSHLFATLLGKGLYYVANNQEQLSAGISVYESGGSLCPPKICNAENLITELQQTLEIDQPWSPAEKEGLALTNGATFCAAMLALGVYDADQLAKTADAAQALTLEAICGRTTPFDPRVQQVRGHAGQTACAATILKLVRGSRYIDQVHEVQDSYSVRCAPAVHGFTRDTIEFVRSVVTHEINAATDNPLVFEEPDDEFGLTHDVFSAGNFHGQPIGMAADFLSIAVAELANISERRTQMLLDENHSRNLPPNLIANPGLNSGLMITQYTAASLVSENKVNAHPSSVDSIPTSANIEDHVAMATTAARKLETIITSTQATLAIELLVATQAVEWRTLPTDELPQTGRVGRNPNAKLSDEPVEVYAGYDVAELEQSELPLQTHYRQQFGCEGDEIPPGRKTVQANLGQTTAQIYQLVRSHVPALIEDIYMSCHLDLALKLVASGQIAKLVIAPDREI